MKFNECIKIIVCVLNSQMYENIYFIVKDDIKGPLIACVFHFEA